MLKLRENCKYDLVCPTSMGVRITPVNRLPVHTSHLFELQATSAESNVLNVSSSLGLKTMVLTTFVKESPIASFIKSELRFRNIDYTGPEVEQGGAWGYRHQFNIADSGFGSRGTTGPARSEEHSRPPISISRRSLRRTESESFTSQV